MEPRTPAERPRLAPYGSLPRDTCPCCNGTGLVWVDLRSLRLGPGGTAFLAAGAKVRYGEDGSVRHALVCPRCGED